MLDIDGLDPWTAVELASELPAESRCIKSLDDRLKWTQADYLLADIFDTLRQLVWLNSKDGVDGVNRPQPSYRPAAPDYRDGEIEGYTPEELLAHLARVHEMPTDDNGMVKSEAEVITG